MTAAQTSILSYYELSGSRCASIREQIYYLIKNNKTLSNRDISNILGIEICTITGRVNELVKDGLIVAWAVKKDLKTNRTVKIWRAVA